MKIKMTVMATIPAVMLAVAGYAEDPSASPKAKAAARGAIEVGAQSLKLQKSQLLTLPSARSRWSTRTA